MAGGAKDFDMATPKANERTHTREHPGGETRPRELRWLAFERFFTTAGVDPMSQVEWDLRAAVIAGEDGRVVFEQRDVEVPRSWSQTAANVVVSKYFRGQIGTPRRETSVRQLISRVVDTISDWGDRQGYFAQSADRDTFKAELTYLLLSQKASFNSPV
ncbi:MAG TPA: hypothetical protein VIX12_01125, partial [Candidatus Binataceae bacterium]